MKKIEDISKQNNFKTPDGYFERFEEEIMERVNSGLPEETRVSAFQVFKPYIYMAACIVILMVSMKAFIKNDTIKTDLSTYNENEYVEDILAEIYDDRLALYEFIEEVYNLNIEFKLSEDPEYLEDYLLQYNIENELFYE